MVAITTITLTLATKNIANGGIDSGNVYLGICGREFRIESAIEDDDDFQRGSRWTYILGDDPPPGTLDDESPPLIRNIHNTTEGNKNTPTINYPLDTVSLVGPGALNFGFPVYVRLDPEDDNWALEYARCSVNPGTQNANYWVWETLMRQPDEFLWLGPRCGKYCYLGYFGKAG